MKALIIKRLEQFSQHEQNMHCDLDRMKLAEQISDDVTDWIRNLWREDFEGPQNGGF